MTEKEIIERQEAEGNREFYLIRQGIFYNAYEGGAYALHRLTGYQLRRKYGKTDGPVTTGFNTKVIENVLKKIEEQGGTWNKTDENTYSFSGIDATPEPSAIKEPKPKAAKKPKPVKEPVAPAHPPETPDYGWLAEAVRNFNLSAATPIDVVCFVSRLQIQLAS